MISHYFPDVSEVQRQQFARLESLYRFWNNQINLISRKDIDNLFLHHILYSLSIAQFIRFTSGTRIMDAGTGGGFPGIPLAILFPDVQFWLVDSIGKKIRVIREIIKEVNLNNVIPVNCRFETMDASFDFITGRAVSDPERFLTMTRSNVSPTQKNEKPNGILYLTGNTVTPLPSENPSWTIIPVSRYFPQPFFSTKCLVYIPAMPPGKK